MNPWKLVTINDALKYCQEAALPYHAEMTSKEKENLASKVLGFFVSDHFSEWREDYPIVDEIEALASDLEWSNSFDVDEDWERLIGYINALDRQVAHNANTTGPQ